jgi:hypothetical protein
MLQGLERRISEEVFGRLLILSVLAALLSVCNAGAQQAPVDTLAAPAPTLADTTAAPEAPVDTTAAAGAPVDTTASVLTNFGANDVDIYGLVTDVNNNPMAGVNVALFVGGLEQQGAVTDTSGAFSMTQALDLAADETVVMWFTPPRGMGYVREIVVLKESKASAEGGHYGPCVTRAVLSPSTYIEVKILDQASNAKRIEDLGCMETAATAASETYDLKYDLPAGGTFTLKSTETQKEMAQGGTQVAATTDVTIEYVFTVASADADGLLLKLEYKDRQLTTDAPQPTGGIDFSPLLGQTASLLLSPTGDLSKFSGFKELPEIATGRGAPMNRETYINELRILFPGLPDHPVSRGDTWSKTHQFQQPMPGGAAANVTIDITYKLAGSTVVRGFNCVEIDSDYTIAVSGQGDLQGEPFTMTMDGKGTEKIYFAHERGMMIEKTGESKVTGATEARGMKFPIDEETVSSVEVTVQ